MMARSLAVVLIALLAISCGCIAGLPGARQASPTTTAPPRIYVTPCRILSENMTVQIAASSLTDSRIASELVKYFPDDFSTPGVNIPSTYYLKCHWAYMVGETEKRLYCDGGYRAPELDEFNVIRRYVWKTFSAGFNVEEHKLGNWVDGKGVAHTNDAFYNLRVMELSTVCYVA